MTTNSKGLSYYREQARKADMELRNFLCGVQYDSKPHSVQDAYSLFYAQLDKARIESEMIDKDEYVTDTQ